MSDRQKPVQWKKSTFKFSYSQYHPFKFFSKYDVGALLVNEFDWSSNIFSEIRKLSFIVLSDRLLHYAL